MAVKQMEYRRKTAVLGEAGAAQQLATTFNTQLLERSEQEAIDALELVLNVYPGDRSAAPGSFDPRRGASLQ